MLCDNCKKNQANVRYSENINGIKKELNLCEECSGKLSIGKLDFNIPLNFSNFFGNFIEEFSSSEYIPLLENEEITKCNICGNTFDNIVETGKLGCGNCYETFSDKIDPILKRIQGNNRHIGRIGKIQDSKIEKEDLNTNNNKEINVLGKLQNNLKQAIKEEKYEEAATIRDEIKKIERR